MQRAPIYRRDRRLEKNNVSNEPTRAMDLMQLLVYRGRKTHIILLFYFVLFYATMGGLGGTTNVSFLPHM